MNNKKAKQMICDVMSQECGQRFCWSDGVLMAEFDNPFWHDEKCWFEAERMLSIVSLTADQLKGK